MRFGFIERHRDEFSVVRMCDVLEVSPSGYYAWRCRPDSARRREDRQLSVGICVVFEQSRSTYGSRRIRDSLQEEGVRCSRSRVSRLMRQEGLVAKKTRQFRVMTTDSEHSLPVAENLLEQDFSPPTVDSVWASDITYIRTLVGWLYLAVVLDLCSRRVVGWATSSSLDTQLCLAALNRAVVERRPGAGLILHSDRGSQYASEAYQDRLEELAACCSMSGVGNCYDNAVVESFFDTLKTEALDGAFETRQQAHEALVSYIEGFYNLRRRHSFLGGLSPVAFERAA